MTDDRDRDDATPETPAAANVVAPEKTSVRFRERGQKIVLELTRELQVLVERIQQLEKIEQEYEILKARFEPIERENRLLDMRIHELLLEITDYKKRDLTSITQIEALGRHVERLHHDRAVIGDYCDKLLMEAQLDPKTKLRTERQYIQQVSLHLELEPRDHVLVFTLFDIGDFKKFNDLIGHEMGDLALKRAAKILRTEIRSVISARNPETQERRHHARIEFIDLKARRGSASDEFLVCTALDPVLDEEGNWDWTPSVAEALHIVDRPCEKFAKIPWVQDYREWAEMLQENPEVANIKPTLDAGVVVVRTGPLPRIDKGNLSSRVKRILKWADKLMYQTKRYTKETGRRRIFYTTAEFHDRKFRELFRGHYDSPVDSLAAE